MKAPTREQAQAMIAAVSREMAILDPEWLTKSLLPLRVVVIYVASDLKGMRMKRRTLTTVWHHLLCAVIERCMGDLDLAADIVSREPKRLVMFGGSAFLLDQMDTDAKMELLIAMSAMGSYDVAVFYSLLEDAGLTWREFAAQHLNYNGNN